MGNPQTRTVGYREDDIDVLCVNCMKMIRVSLAGEHSLHCVQVNSEVKLLDQCSLIQQTDYKIRRLKDSVTRVSQDAVLRSLRPNNWYYVKMLSMSCDDLLAIVDYTKADIVKSTEVLATLTTLSKGFNGSPCIAIYLERLTVLAQEKCSQLLSYYKEIAASNPEMRIEKTVDQLMHEAQTRTEQFRRSKNSALEMRSSVSSDRTPTQVYNKAQINKAKPTIEDVRSDAGLEEEYCRPLTP